MAKTYKFPFSAAEIEQKFSMIPKQWSGAVLDTETIVLNTAQQIIDVFGENSKKNAQYQKNYKNYYIPSGTYFMGQDTIEIIANNINLVCDGHIIYEGKDCAVRLSGQNNAINIKTIDVCDTEAIGFEVTPRMYIDKIVNQDNVVIGYTPKLSKPAFNNILIGNIGENRNNEIRKDSNTLLKLAVPSIGLRLYIPDYPTYYESEDTRIKGTGITYNYIEANRIRASYAAISENCCNKPSYINCNKFNVKTVVGACIGMHLATCEFNPNETIYNPENDEPKTESADNGTNYTTVSHINIENLSGAPGSGYYNGTTIPQIAKLEYTKEFLYLILQDVYKNNFRKAIPTQDIPAEYANYDERTKDFYNYMYSFNSLRKYSPICNWTQYIPITGTYYGDDQEYYEFCVDYKPDSNNPLTVNKIELFTKDENGNKIINDIVKTDLINRLKTKEITQSYTQKIILNKDINYNNTIIPIGTELNYVLYKYDKDENRITYIYKYRNNEGTYTQIEFGLDHELYNITRSNEYKYSIICLKNPNVSMLYKDALASLTRNEHVNANNENGIYDDYVLNNIITKTSRYADAIRGGIGILQDESKYNNFEYVKCIPGENKNNKLNKTIEYVLYLYNHFNYNDYYFVNIDLNNVQIITDKRYAFDGNNSVLDMSPEQGEQNYIESPQLVFNGERVAKTIQVTYQGYFYSTETTKIVPISINNVNQRGFKHNECDVYAISPLRLNYITPHSIYFPNASLKDCYIVIDNFYRDKSDTIRIKLNKNTAPKGFIDSTNNTIWENNGNFEDGWYELSFVEYSYDNTELMSLVQTKGVEINTASGKTTIHDGKIISEYPQKHGEYIQNVSILDPISGKYLIFDSPVENKFIVGDYDNATQITYTDNIDSATKFRVKNVENNYMLYYDSTSPVTQFYKCIKDDSGQYKYFSLKFKYDKSKQQLSTVYYNGKNINEKLVVDENNRLNTSSIDHNYISKFKVEHIK